MSNKLKCPACGVKIGEIEVEGVYYQPLKHMTRNDVVKEG